MAGFDHGVITAKNGNLLKENKGETNYVSQGMAGAYFNKQLGIAFDREFAYGTNREHLFDDWLDVEPDFLMRFQDQFYDNHIKTYRWDYNGINFKTRSLADGIYQTDFKFDNDFYHVLQGWDISLDFFNHKKTYRAVNKFLQKYTGKTLKHVKIEC